MLGKHKLTFEVGIVVWLMLCYATACLDVRLLPMGSGCPPVLFLHSIRNHYESICTLLWFLFILSIKV